jgi:predicted GIY-YIG superfamily endonuclease
MKEYTVYILRCADGTLYTGITNDLAQRLDQHNAGRGAKYTRGRVPVKLLYKETGFSRSTALLREAAIKKMSVAAKKSLVNDAAKYK